MSKVFVVDTNKQPLNPVHPGRARLLLTQGKAAVWRRYPFTIILKKVVDEPEVTPLRVKLDPGSKTTGIAIVDDESGEVVFAAELQHRGSAIKKALDDRRAVRRSRRQRKTRYRKPRFAYRKRPKGWLPPSQISRITNVLTWVRRLQKFCPITTLSMELVRFDMQLMQNPNISGVEYQQGTLYGYEVREYLLEKWQRKCAYCGKSDVPLQVEHILARANGGTDRISNLCLACQKCNIAKGTKDIKDFLKKKPEALKRILVQTKAPLGDAAAVNATRWILLEQLKTLGLPIECGSGGLTKFNRTTRELPKSHWLDAACVCKSTPLPLAIKGVVPLLITANGHGCRQMRLADKRGFPRGKPKQAKVVKGFQTGDMVKAIVTSGARTGVYVGRVAVRARGTFNITTNRGEIVQDIHYRFCKTLHHSDGYSYGYGKLSQSATKCRRTQSGELHDAMKELLPNAMFIGFTGTPLLKANKQKSSEIFGSYIHTYKFDEAVKDQVVLDLRYEARDIEQNITSQKKIDQWFDAKTRGLNDIALAQLKRKWGTMQKVLSSQSRLAMIVADIMMDMATKDRLTSGLGNAMLVSGSIYQACKFYELFISQGFDKCAIVTSYKPSVSDIKGEETGEGLTEKLKQYDIYNKMLGGKDPEKFEQEVKQKFIDEPGQMKLLIVVDKLLTGFDAPSATYLYIDKQMRDHGLFQAICRVNRLDGEDKQYGYIIDYKDLFKSLERSIQDYTSEALDGYDRDDVQGLLKNRIVKAREQLEEARETIKMLCEPVDPPRETMDYIGYFCAKDTADKDALKENEPKRVALYKFTASLIRAFANLANDLPEAGYTPREMEQIKREVDYYEKVRREIKIASGDYIDLKVYEPAMRHLIDTYIRAEESEKISAFDDISLLQLIVERGVDGLTNLPRDISNNKAAMAETIENNMRRVIIDERPTNPMYYDKMSEVLDTLIQERQQQAQEYEQYLAKIVELARQVQNPTSGTAYPKALNTRARRVLYDNLGNNEQLAISVDRAIQSIKKDGWRNNKIKEKEVRYAIRGVLSDETLTEQILEIVKQQDEY